MLKPGAILEGLLDLLAPPRCPGCDEVLLGEESGFCGGCGVLLDPAAPAVLPPARGASLHVFAGPLADALKSKAAAKNRYYQCIRHNIAASVNGVNPGV